MRQRGAVRSSPRHCSMRRGAPRASNVAHLRATRGDDPSLRTLFTPQPRGASAVILAPLGGSRQRPPPRAPLEFAWCPSVRVVLFCSLPASLVLLLRSSNLPWRCARNDSAGRDLHSLLSRLEAARCRTTQQRSGGKRRRAMQSRRYSGQVQGGGSRASHPVPQRATSSPELWPATRLTQDGRLTLALLALCALEILLSPLLNVLRLCLCNLSRRDAVAERPRATAATVSVNSHIAGWIER